MKPDQIDLITRMMREEKHREDIKRELISQGFSTAGFEGVYRTLLTELHLTEPKKTAMESSEHSAYTRTIASNTYRRSKRNVLHVRAALRKLFLFAVLLAVIGVGIHFLSPDIARFFSERMSMQILGGLGLSKDLSVSDVLLRSKVETTVSSAHLYGGRMGSYDGMCKDVPIIAPIKCLQTNHTFAIYAPLSDGTFYCMDSAGFAGSVKQLPAVPGSCT